MVQHYKKALIDLKKTSIWKNWIVIAFILTFGFVNVNAEQRCCYSTSSQLISSSANTYKLNVTASHVDSEKAGNEYFVAISFQQGYSVIGDPYSPFSKVTCSLTPGAIPQYNCHSKDSKTFFVIFDLSILPTPLPNSTITASSVFIFSDKCQNVPYCTDLAAKHDSEDSDKISLGPLGTWPKYAVIIGGVILGITLLVACYLVYKRNRPDESYRDTSITPGTTYNDKNRIFSPNSLLRNGGDDDLPPPNDPPKNTLIQFGNVSAHSPERSKSVKKNRNDQTTTTTTTLTSKPSTKKKNHHDIEIKSDDDKFPSVIIDMNGSNNLERSKSHKSKRSNNSKDNNNVNNRLSGYSTSELSKTISNNDISDRELSDNNNNDEFYSSNTKKYSRSSTSLHRSKSKIRNSVDESRRPFNNNHNNNNNNSHNSSSSNNNNNHHKPHRRSTSKGAGEDRDGHKIDRKNSGRHRSHSRSRKNSSPPPPASKSTSDLQRSLSTRQTDRKSFSNDRELEKNNNVSSRSNSKLDRKGSIKHKDLISNADTESTASSSDIPLSDKLPLAMLVTKLPSSGQSNSWKPDKVINEEDDDTTPLGRISSFGATSTSSQSYLPTTTDKLTDDIINYYDSILDDVLNVNNDDDDDPIRKSLSMINKENEKEKESGTINDEEIPIGQLRSG